MEFKKNKLKINDSVETQMYDLMIELFPICRSITGDGVRKTFDILKKIIKITTHEISTGTKVFDWVIPKEWKISDAYIIDPNGKKILDFQKSNLHVMQYSTPINKEIGLDELKSHIHTIPNKPQSIPYITSYYNEDWGFCMTDEQLKKLNDGIYKVVIDSELKDGSLTYGEYYIEGKTKQEVIFSTYICHPSLCNDNLSGMILLVFLAQFLQTQNLTYSYRFIFVPETIGAITWLNKNENRLNYIKHGLLVTCVGDSGNFTYKKTRQENADIDKIVINTLKKLKLDFNIQDFFPYGSDERQFCSPGFNLPVGSLMRTPYRQFAQYHSSEDNLEFVKKESLLESLKVYLEVVSTIENKEDVPDLEIKKIESPTDTEIFINTNPKCEPQLGRRGIYRNFGFRRLDVESDEIEKFELAIFWILNYSDGNNSLGYISKKSGISLDILRQTALKLLKCNLLEKVNHESN